MEVKFIAVTISEGGSIWTGGNRFGTLPVEVGWTVSAVYPAGAGKLLLRMEKVEEEIKVRP